MMNRLLLPWQRQLLLVVGLISWTLTLNAQCECGTATNTGNMQSCGGDLFTLTYTGQDTFYVGTDCMEPLLNPSASIAISPGFDTIIYDVPLTGYSFGDDVMGGTVVTVHYIIKGNGVEDTLCFDLSFLDDTPPLINTTLSTDTVACDLLDLNAWVTAKQNQVDANTSDNCSFVTSNNAPATWSEACATLEVTFYAEDDAGNLDSVMASLTTIDTVGPTLVGVPAGVIIDCDDTVPTPPTVTATDICSGTSNVVFTETSTQTNDGSDTDNDYTIQRTWMVADNCGNSSMATQIINVQDVNPPMFDVPADTTITCDAPSDTTSTGNISNITDCADLSEITISLSEAILPGSCPNEMTIQRTWTLEDLNLNVVSKTQTITVVDTIQPTVTFPADITVDCSDAADISVTGEPTNVSDNCTAIPNEAFVDVVTAGSCQYSYSVERTWKVWDDCTDTVEQVQIITVTDTINPVIGNEAVNQTITCAMDIDALFMSWVDDHGAATATDNCSETDSLDWVAYVAGTTDPAALPGPDCLNPDLGIFRRVTVDFIVNDDCGNTDTTTATFTVADDNPPVIMSCPSDMTVDADLGVCEANLPLQLPVIMEDCGNAASTVSVSQTFAPTIPSGSDPVETPIDDLVFNLNVPPPPISADGTAALTIYLNAMDAEAPTEFVNVYGEDGSLLGAVANTPTQCGDTLTTFTLSETQVNAWAFDGTVTITVASNIPAGQSGIFAVNPICPGGTITAELTYSSNDPTGIQFEYAINGGTRTAVNPLASFNDIFPQGTSTVDYYVIDCAGNEATCNFTVTVEDNEAPTIDCPADISVTLGAGNCEEEIEVPLFTNVTDNCGVTTPTTQTQPMDSLDQLITFSYNPNLGGFVADDKSFTFSGLEGNATPGGVQLIVTIQGGIDSVGAYFEIYDNDGSFLGTTANDQPFVTPGDCNTPSVAIFTIPATTFNDWASAGDITITAKSFVNYPIPPAGPGWGINPCAPSQVNNDGDTDGSFITAMFSYESVSPSFSSSGATSIDPVALTPPLEAETYSLAQGVTTFTYSVTDLAGNDGECSFDIEVIDAEAPNALCGPAFVDINPSGFDVDTIFANEIDLGSTDNCTIASMTVAPNVFDCDDQGIQNVVLTVTDGAGNVSTCSTFVNVTTQAPAPSISSDCGTPDLQLFANPPASSGGSNAIYTYTWSKGGVPFAFVENPIVQDANLDDIGFYTVEIEGVSGCISQSSVQVTCNMLPLAEPVTTVNATEFCASETIVLTTASVCGSTVEYHWYGGAFPGTLMATTTLPSYSMLPSTSGVFEYYVVVERNACESVPSDPVQVTVNEAPTAQVGLPNIVECEGAQILLQSLNTPLGATCEWIGPAGYTSSSCNPAPLANLDEVNEGFYQLIVTNNGCESIPDTTVVNVTPRPEKPTASSTTTAVNPACDGESIVLTASSVPGAVSYQWTSPTNMEFTSSTNSLSISSCDITKDAGFWTVLVMGNSCESEPSDEFEVFIAPLPEAVEATASPVSVCEGSTVELSGSSATPNVNYLWTTPSGQPIAQAEPSINDVSTDDDGTYDLLVTSQFGCTATTSVDVTILERVDITGLASDEPECPPGPVDVNLVATLFPPDNGTYEYTWTGPNGFESTDASAIIPEATDFDSGPYILRVTNGEGCESLPITLTVDINETLESPDELTTASGDLVFCEGESLTLNATGYNGAATYIWTTPTSTFSTNDESIELSDLTVAEEGQYTVQYQVGNCISPLSGILEVEVNPIPLIAPTSNTPVCEGTMIEMEVNCDNGAEYEWNGPNGFAPSVCNPTILNADPAQHTGIYSVRKMVDGCWSDVQFFTVEVKEQPDVPTAINAGPYCADTEDITLSVAGNSATLDATYTWFDADSIPLGSATPSLDFALPNGAIFADGQYEFFAVANLDGCPSNPSAATTVTINTVPQNLAEAGDDVSACEGDILNLDATIPTIGTGLWTLVDGNPNGLAIANPDEATTTVDGLLPGSPYLFEWTLSNGACTDYSSDTMEIFVNFVEMAEAGEAIDLCFTNELTLDADEPISNVGMWTQPQSQENLGITIDDPTNPNTTISGVPGISNQFIFTWTIDGGCGSSEDQLLVNINYEEAFAGDDFFHCGEEAAILPSVNGDGVWSSPDIDIDIVYNQSEEIFEASNFLTGTNVLVWTIDDGACGEFSVDSVVVEYQAIPVLADDAATIDFGGSQTFDVTDNDDITGPYVAGLVEAPMNGTAEIDFDGMLSYTANSNFVGTDVVVYEICGESCGDCVSATVTFKVGDDAECIPPTIFTPNSDGMNDYFVIPCLDVSNDRFPVRILSVFNQWGDEVYHAEQYQNDWAGTFEGEDLPAGTYFYFLDLGNGAKPVSGYLTLQR